MRIRPIVILPAILLFVLSSPAWALERITLHVPDKYKKGVFSEERVLEAPPGIRVSVFAADAPGARFMAASEDGTIYLSVPSDGTVLAFPDRDGDGVADEKVVFARGLKRPHGLAFRGKKLVVAETGSLIELEDTDNDLKADTKRVISGDLPAGGGHWTKSIAIGPDGAIYVSGGSSCNVCIERDRRRAAVLRFTGPDAEVFATGLRNSVGMEFHPGTGELWGVDNGRDGLGDNIPPEELNRIRKGGDYGWPYCYGDRLPDPGYGSPDRCKDTIPPAVAFQAHSAPLGVAFGKGLKSYPKRLTESFFIALHGSWNRSVPTGYKLVAIHFKDGRPEGPPFDVVTGWLVDEDAWGRPVDALVGRDGALYLSDDRAGAIYRIYYSLAKQDR